MGVAKGDTRSYTVALMGTSMRDFAKKLDPVIHTRLSTSRPFVGCPV